MNDINSNDATDKDLSDSLDDGYLSPPENPNLLPTPNNAIVSCFTLNVLQNKNRIITLLKKQIQNQKVQLQFYLHRELSGPKVIEMAKHCVPVEAEENLAVNLALVQFCNQAGLKSRIAVLHDRMCVVEQQVLRLVENQENAIQTIFFKLDNSQWNEGQQCEIFAKILDATCILRSELEAFRTCCNRLIMIEDERNGLVEQVYSVPVSERINYNALLATLHEKTRLEKEIIEIKSEQKQLLTRLNSVGSVPLNKGKNQLIKRVRKTEKNDINRLKEINGTLMGRINSLEQDMECKEIIENKMENVIEEYQRFRDNAGKQLMELHSKLGIVIEENEELTKLLDHYEEVENEVKDLRNRLGEASGLQKERDHLKQRFKELQALCNNYAQMAKKPFISLGDATKIINQQKHQLLNMNEELLLKKNEIIDLLSDLQDKEHQIRMLNELVLSYESAKLPEKLVTDAVMNTPMKNYKDVGCNFSRPPPTPKHYTQSTNRAGDRQKYIRVPEKKCVRMNKMKPAEMYPDAVPVTVLKVRTVNNKGLTETLRAVVESTSPVDGVIQLTNNSAFTVRLTCGTQMEGQNLAQTEPDNLEECTNAFQSTTLDEFELMKDSSKEALVPRMTSLNALVQGQLVQSQQRQIFVDGDKCEQFTIDSIYEAEAARDYSDLDISDVDIVEVDDCDSQSSDDVSIQDRINQLAENSLCRQVFDKLFHDVTKP